MTKLAGSLLSLFFSGGMMLKTIIHDQPVYLREPTHAAMSGITRSRPNTALFPSNKSNHNKMVTGMLPILLSGAATDGV